MKSFFIDFGVGKPEYYLKAEEAEVAFTKAVIKYLQSLEISGMVTDLQESSSVKLSSGLDIVGDANDLIVIKDK